MICRDPAFWRPICEHPAVKPHVSLGFEGDWLTPVLESRRCLPWASVNGGYFLFQADFNDRVWDLHAAFRPEGWGREAHDLLIAVLACPIWSLMTVTEVEGNWRSRPPRSFGFRQAGPCLWFLTRAAWEQSPAFKRMLKRCLQPSLPQP